MQRISNPDTEQLSIYIAGPMRGFPKFNFPLFNAAAKLWRQRGWKVVSPAEIDVEVDGLDPDNPVSAKPFKFYMRRDVKLLLEVDAVAFLPGWESSEGARVEYTVARALDLICLDALTGDLMPKPESCVGALQAV